MLSFSSLVGIHAIEYHLKRQSVILVHILGVVADLNGFLQAILSKQRAETLSSVLYPDDRTYEGKELRLKQQHFFVSATIQVRFWIYQWVYNECAVLGILDYLGELVKS